MLIGGLRFDIFFKDRKTAACHNIREAFNIWEILNSKYM